MTELRPHHIKISGSAHEGEANFVEKKTFSLITAQRNCPISRQVAITSGLAKKQRVAHLKETNPRFIHPASGTRGSVFEDEQAVIAAPGSGAHRESLRATSAELARRE